MNTDRQTNKGTEGNAKQYQRGESRKNAGYEEFSPFPTIFSRVLFHGFIIPRRMHCFSMCMFVCLDLFFLIGWSKCDKTLHMYFLAQSSDTLLF